MARRAHRGKRKPPPAALAPRRSARSIAASAVVLASLVGIAIWTASVTGWLSWGTTASRPGVSLMPSRTGIPLPADKTAAVFEDAPTASGKSEASAAVFACIEKLYVNNDVLQPLRRELDYQIWPNPDYIETRKNARYLFRLRPQIQYSADGPRLIAEIRSCTALP